MDPIVTNCVPQLENQEVKLLSICETQIATMILLFKINLNYEEIRKINKK